MTFPDDDTTLPSGQTPRGQMDEDHDPSQEDASNIQAASSADDSQFLPLGGLTPEFDFPRVEEDVAAFHREINALGMTSVNKPSVDNSAAPTNQAPRRRRRTPRITERLSASDIGERLESISQRSSPTVDFFVFSFLCGCILGVGYILDAPAILLIGILVAPMLGPWVGASLSAATGEIRFFRQTFGAVLTGFAVVFIVGYLAGLASRIFQPLTLSQAFYHARLWLPDLLMLVIGTAVLVIGFIRSDDKPIIPSLMVAYQLYLTVSAAGFGLGSNVQGLWPQAGLVLLIHLALSFLIGLVIFFYMGFRPLDPRGYMLMAVLVLFGLFVVAGFAGFGSLVNVRGDQAYSTPVETSSPTPEIIPTNKPKSTIKPLEPTVTAYFTPSPRPSATEPDVVPTVELTPLAGISSAPTLVPTPVYGRVQSQSGGVIVRVEPGGNSMTTVENGYLAEILGDVPVVVDGGTWIHVVIRTPLREINGWVLSELIVTATPSFSP